MGRMTRVMRLSSSVILTVLLCLVAYPVRGSDEPNPPTWPKNVYVLDPNDPTASQAIVDQVFAENGGQVDNGQWSNDRYALLFEEGEHNVKVQVGYYTSVMGLGVEPSDTTIRSVECQNGDYNPSIGALNTFWRSAENFRMVPYQEFNGVEQSMLWAVSQASPMRRVIIDGNLQLFQYNYGNYAGYASGGYLSDAVVTGSIYSGSQQQWFTRNSKVSEFVGGGWNMVFLGVENAPQWHCSDDGGEPYTTIASTPVIAEKPYLHKDPSTGRWFLMVPPVEYDKVGSTADYTTAQSIDFSMVYVATEEDSADVINGKLQEGKHIVLSAGNYYLDSPINVTKSNTVVLGVGFPTLISNNGEPCITVVSGINGVRVSQVLFQAGKIESPSLFIFGDGNGDDGQALGGLQPTPYNFIHDLFARVGGPNDPSDYQVYTDTMAIVNQDLTIIDNTWLWRADHDVSGLVMNGDNPVNNGIIVNGDDIKAYGFKVEHTLQDLTIWNGDNGEVYFYQSELPYDVSEDFGESGYTSYVVSDEVTSHVGYGIGVYCYFRDYSVTVQNGIVSGPNVQFFNSLTVFLNGNGEIVHTINGQGSAVSSPASVAYVCNYNSNSTTDTER